jgi:hypothetical protein
MNALRANVVFLDSSYADWITDTIVSVDGGLV